MLYKKKINSLIFIIFLLFIIIPSIIISIPFIHDLKETNKNLYFIINIFYAQIICILIPTVIYIVKNNIHLKSTLAINKINFIQIISIIGFTIFIMPLTYFINAFSLLFFENSSTEILGYTQNMSLIMSLFLLAIIPAFNEEFLFRGLLYNSYKSYNKRQGLIISALLFGMLHMNFNQFLYAFVLGIIFVLLNEATNSTLSSMLAHFIINGFSVFVTFLISNMPTDIYSSAVIETSTIEIIIAIIFYGFLALIFTPIALLILYYLAKNSNRLDELKCILKNKSSELQPMYKDNLFTIEIYFCIAIFLLVNSLYYFF